MASVGRKRRRDEVEVTSSDDDDYLSDSAVYLPSPRELTDEDLTEYYRQSFSSQGFDVPDYGGSLPGGIVTLWDSKSNGSFEFDKLVKVNSQSVAGFMFYITFTARSGDNASQTFHGKVWQTLDKTLDVQFCEMDTKQEAEAGISQEAGTSQEAEAGISQEAEAVTSQEAEAGISQEAEAGTSQEAGTSEEAQR